MTTLSIPLSLAEADAPYVESWSSSRRLLVQRGGAELAVQELGRPAADLGMASTVRFPAPWPRRFGRCAVSPAGDLAVFAGVHALRAVDRTGAVRWELRHRCWAGCEGHAAFEEYASDREHRYASSGSAGFSADGALVWAHIRGPLVQDRLEHHAWVEEWLVIDAANGRVLARADTRTAAAGSVHVPHPDPSQMGLSVGEGQEGAPLRWGRWDGETLSVDYFEGEDRMLSAVSPSGKRLLTVTHDQDILAVHQVVDGSVEAELGADVVPRHPEAEEDYNDLEVFWDYEGGFIDEDTSIVGTVESDEEFGTGRHWLVDVNRMVSIEELTYPIPVSGLPRALGDGTWYTVSETDNVMHVWTLP
ncbi:hypothetical protein ACFW1M_43155 [Streptomyces inhibens]|uniref:hypothetical protein n=1 Tax=Streptomyces inhibens TaxID=2293571 RepID=UPI00368AF4ED